MKNNNVILTQTVRDFQVDNDELIFADILQAYRGQIQGKTYKVNKRYGLDEDAVESELVMALWAAASTWDETTGIVFEKYVNVKWTQALNHLFFLKKRKEDSIKSIELVYCLSSCYGENSEDYDIVDPAFDIEQLVEDNERVESLLAHIGKDKPSLAQVAALRACGYEYIEIADLLGYNPENIHNVKKAKINWTGKRLFRARKLATEFYEKIVGEPIPISVRL